MLKFQNNLLLYLTKLKNLDEIIYNKDKINYKSIIVFDNNNNYNNINIKKLNDTNNKKRENIIGAIINYKIPNDYYLLSKRWKFIKTNIDNYLKLLNIDNNKEVKLIHKGGRKYNYDFIIKDNNKEYNIEFKFNVKNKNEAPQFVSPMNPSKFLSSSYEKYFYENYLSNISKKGKLKMPKLDKYLKEINSNKPKCIKKYQDLYYKGCKNSSKFTNNENDIKFYEYCKKCDNESRINFINNNELKINDLSNYLLESQNNKIYMLYKDGYFYKQEINKNDYILTSYDKLPEKYKYICYSKSGNKINVLLRWKNGNGIAFPSFQIS
jgi:hypothetical protein